MPDLATVLRSAVEEDADGGPDIGAVRRRVAVRRRRRWTAVVAAAVVLVTGPALLLRQDEPASLRVVTEPSKPVVEELDGAQLFPVGGRPLSVAVGFGSVWVLTEVSEDLAVRSVDRLDLMTGELESRTPFRTPVERVVIAARSLWVLGGGTTWRLPPNGEAPILVGGVAEDPNDVDADGLAVWLSDGAGKVVRLDDDRVTADVAVEGVPSDVSVAPDGGVWVTQSATNTYVRIDPVTLDVVPYGSGRVIAATGADEVWVASGDTLLPVFPSLLTVGQSVSQGAPRLRGLPVTQAVVVDGGAWVANDPGVGYYRSETGIPARPEPGTAWTTGPVRDLAVDGDDVWFVLADGRPAVLRLATGGGS